MVYAALDGRRRRRLYKHAHYVQEANGKPAVVTN
nr:MAG TPA: hypothetical protein [Caudoviricetes sp.]